MLLKRSVTGLMFGLLLFTLGACNSASSSASSNSASTAQALVAQACGEWDAGGSGDPENPNHPILKKLAQAALLDLRWSSLVKDFYIITDRTLESGDPLLDNSGYDWMAQCRIARVKP